MAKTKRTNLSTLSIKEKQRYLCDVVYENIKHSSTGKLLISTYYCKKVAELLGGNYLMLNDIQKDIFRAEIVTQSIIIDEGFGRYTKY